MGLNIFFCSLAISASAVAAASESPSASAFSSLLGVFDSSEGFAVLLVYIIKILFYAEHVAMVGYSHAGHAVGHRFVNERRYRRHSVEQRIFSMYVQVYELTHNI